jgi:putative FmdB family regulatory protein
VPTYQYACTECGHRLEAVQSFSDDPLTVCPECEGRLRKVFSAVGVVFKGSGFYRTDSRAGASTSTSASNGKGASDTKSSTNGTSGANGTSSANGASGTTSGSTGSTSGSSKTSTATAAS